MTTQSSSFSFISLGCARTLVDSENIVNSLHGAGFELVEEGSQESITVLNTCSFIQAAIDETESNIRHLINKKKMGELQYLAVVGCYPSRFKKPDLEAKFPEVDIWLTTQEEGQLKNQLSELVFKRKFAPSKQVKYTKLTPSHYTYLKISEGCDNWCAFCTIPKIRGTHTSRSTEDLIAETKQHIALGTKELLLVAEDTTAWGDDIYGEPRFHELLTALSDCDVEWIRPMYIFPSRVDSTLIQTMKNTPRITPYIDMPIQHVNSELLASMNRRHDKAFLEKIMDEMVQEIPDIAVRTTFIIGYPGETEEHVDELIEFIEKYPFTHIGCFGYSEEKETRAARLEDKVPENVIRERIQRVMSRQFELLQERHKARIGKQYRYLYEGNGYGRTVYEAPEVDGIVRVEDSDTLEPGQFYDVEITGVDGYDLTCKLV